MACCDSCGSGGSCEGTPATLYAPALAGCTTGACGLQGPSSGAIGAEGESFTIADLMAIVNGLSMSPEAKAALMKLGQLVWGLRGQPAPTAAGTSTGASPMAEKILALCARFAELAKNDGLSDQQVQDLMALAHGYVQPARTSTGIAADPATVFNLGRVLTYQPPMTAKPTGVVFDRLNAPLPYNPNLAVTPPRPRFYSHGGPTIPPGVDIETTIANTPGTPPNRRTFAVVTERGLYLHQTPATGTSYKEIVAGGTTVEVLQTGILTAPGNLALREWWHVKSPSGNDGYVAAVGPKGERYLTVTERTGTVATGASPIASVPASDPSSSPSRLWRWLGARAQGGDPAAVHTLYLEYAAQTVREGYKPVLESYSEPGRVIPGGVDITIPAAPGGANITAPAARPRFFSHGGARNTDIKSVNLGMTRLFADGTPDRPFSANLAVAQPSPDRPLIQATPEVQPKILPPLKPTAPSTARVVGARALLLPPYVLGTDKTTTYTPEALYDGSRFVPMGATVAITGPPKSAMMMAKSIVQGQAAVIRFDETIKYPSKTALWYPVAYDGPTYGATSEDYGDGRGPVPAPHGQLPAQHNEGWMRANDLIANTVTAGTGRALPSARWTPMSFPRRFGTR